MMRVFDQQRLFFLKYLDGKGGSRQRIICPAGIVRKRLFEHFSCAFEQYLSDIRYVDGSTRFTRPTQAPRWPHLEPPSACCTQNAKSAGMRQPPAKPQHRTAAPPGTVRHTQLARSAHQATNRPHQPIPHSHSPVLPAPVPFWPQPRWRPCRWQQNRARPWQGQVHARPGPQGR